MALQSLFRTTTNLKVNPADTTISVAVLPTATSGRIRLYSSKQEELVKYTGISGTPWSAGTLTGCTRNLSFTADPATWGTWLTWVAGSQIELVIMHDQLIDKQNGSQVQVYATTTARDAAITSPENGMTAYITADGVFTDYIGWAWTNRATGTTPNASTTVAGKVEIATTAESQAGTDTWGTGASLSVLPSDIAKNIQSATFVYGADVGGDDTYVVALTPTLTTYTTGQTLTMKVSTANTWACTVDFWPWAKSIKMPDWSDPINGAVSGIVQVTYDGTNFVLSSTPQDNLAISTKWVQTYHTQQVPLSETMSGWTITTTNITFTAWGHTELVPSGGASMNQNTTLPWNGTTSSYSPTFNKEIRVLWRWRALSLSTDRAGFWITTGGSNIYADQTDTITSAVRFVNNGGTLYAHNTNGTTATATNVTGSLTLANFNTYEVVFTPWVSATFYINGTLVATHTTNLPTTGTFLLAYWTSANGRSMHIYPPIVSIQL